MSRIDELIAEHCPLGVEVKSLGDVGEFIRGNGLQKSDLTDRGTPAIHYGQLHTFYGIWTTTTKSFTDPALAAKLRRAKPGDLIVATTSEDDAAVAKATAWIGDGEVAVSGDAYIYRHSLDPRYAAYFFQSEQFRGQKTRHISGTKVRRISGTSLAKIWIPVPPLEVQREIVRILDQFTALEAELEAELEARRHQHAFYWQSVLSPREGWRMTTVGEVAQVFDGPHATPTKTQDGPWYLSISSLKNGRFDLAESAHLGEDEFPTWTRRVAPRLGDTMFSYETRLGQAAFWERNDRAALGRRMGLLRPRESVINPRFLTLVYLGPQFQALIRAKTVSGSTVDRIPIADMASWQLAIPPLEEQKRIVDILDSFDALVNDLSVGLPAELAARRKQYEYYRDRLLTFEEVVA
jgi:type I restriction enzyme S subunit